MKFWQLVSLFRPHLPSLERLLERPEWAQYLTWYKAYNHHVNSQNRNVLDSDLPEVLVLTAMAQFNYCFQVKHGVLYRCDVAGSNSFSASEAYRRYGADAIEEVFEKGSYRVSDP